MKKVAGFHSFERWGLAGTRDFSGLRKAFGMIECHTEGWATRGKFSVEVAYVRQWCKCEEWTGRDNWSRKDLDDDLYAAVRCRQPNAVAIVF